MLLQPASRSYAMQDNTPDNKPKTKHAINAYKQNCKIYGKMNVWNQIALLIIMNDDK